MLVNVSVLLGDLRSAVRIFPYKPLRIKSYRPGPEMEASPECPRKLESPKARQAWTLTVVSRGREMRTTPA